MKSYDKHGTFVYMLFYLISQKDKKSLKWLSLDLSFLIKYLFTCILLKVSFFFLYPIQTMVLFLNKFAYHLFFLTLDRFTFKMMILFQVDSNFFYRVCKFCCRIRIDIICYRNFLIQLRYQIFIFHD